MKSQIEHLYLKASIDGAMTFGAFIGAAGNAVYGVAHVVQGNTVEGLAHFVLGSYTFYAGVHTMEMFADELTQIEKDNS